MKMTKKFISVILAVVMVVSTLPMTVFAGSTTYTADDQVAQDAQAAIKAYELKMDGTIYKNMQAAYDAYLNVVMSYNVYVYGDYDNGLANYVSVLNTATDNMTTDGIYDWSNYEGVTSVQPTFNSTAVSSGTYYNNILYSADCTSGNSNYSDGETSGAAVIFDEAGGTKVQVYYPETVVLYDGNDIIVPVMFCARKTVTNERRVYTVYPAVDNGNANERQDDNLYWKSLYNVTGTDSLNFKGGDKDPNSLNFNTMVGRSSLVGSAKNNAGHYSDKLATSLLNSRFWWQFYATGFKFTEQLPNLLGSNGYYDFKPYWYWTGSNGTSSAGDNTHVDTNMKGYKQAEHSIHILNLKGMLDIYSDAMDRATDYSMNVENYRNDTAGASLSNFFKGLDAMTSLTLTEVQNATPSTVAAVGQKLSTAIQYGPSTGTPLASTGYAALRDAMEARRSTYNGDGSKYESGWTEFVTAYEDAKTFMRSCMTAPYDNDQAQALADALNACELVLNFTPASVSTLAIVISDAQGAVNKRGMFTDSDAIDSLEALISTAKATGWPNGEFLDEAAVCDIALQDNVDAKVQELITAIRTLQIDTNFEIGAAWDRSMVSAINEAGQLNAADWTNYDEVAAAVQAAQNFDINVISATTDISDPTVGFVTNKISEYTNLVRNIMVAIKSLKASFIAMPDCQVQTYTMRQVNFTAGSKKGHDMTIRYNYPDDVVVFRTQQDAKVAQLPDSVIEFKATPNETKLGASYMDAFNINSSAEGNAGELSSNYDNNDHSYSNASSYNGNLSKTVTVNSANYILTLGYNASVEGSGIFGSSMSAAGFYGIDLNNNNVTDSGFDWTDSLRNASGQSSGSRGPVGSIVSLNSDTKLNATTALSIPAKTTVRPTMVTVPVAQDTNVSAFCRWSAAGAAARVYYGYTSNSTKYSQTVYVIDIKGLLDLVRQVSDLQRNDSTTSSWQLLQNKLSAATADLPETAVTAADMLQECQTRYDDLNYQKGQLVPAAKNDSIDSALAAAKLKIDAVDAGTEHYSSTSYSNFLAARQAALDAVNGDYSDESCLDIEKNAVYGVEGGVTVTNQQHIDNIAQAVLDAIAALVSFANFEAIDNAVATTIDNYKYSKADLEAVNTFVSSLPYASMTDEERAVVEAEDEIQAAINDEATQIVAKINELKSKEITAADKDAFKATSDELDVADPDAYSNIEDKKTVRNQYYVPGSNDFSAVLYETVNVLGKDVIALRTQSEVDAITAEIASLALQQYTVYVDGVQYGVYDFGSEAEVDFGKNCAIYYAYTSNTATNVEKYFTTDSLIRFVVKGNTYLTTKADSGVQTVKINYINGLKNKVFDTDYVETNTTVVLPEAPSIAYYTFLNYRVNGVEMQPGETIEVTDSISIIANYEYANEDNEFEIVIYYNKNGIGTRSALFTSLYYNRRVDLTDAGFKNCEPSAKKYIGAKFVADGVEIAPAPEKLTDVVYMKNTDPIYAYATIDENDVELFEEYFDGDDYIIPSEVDESFSYSEDAEQLAGKLHVVGYGPDYSFFASGNTTIYALTQEDYDHAVAAGIIEVDQNGADVSVKEELVDATTKWSIVGTFAIPEGAALVENGVLFTTNDSDLKFSAVDGTNVYRFKSSQHTVGNQFVISLSKPASTAIDGKYLAYTIYELNGKQYTVTSKTIENTFTVA